MALLGSVKLAPRVMGAAVLANRGEKIQVSAPRGLHCPQPRPEDRFTGSLEFLSAPDFPGAVFLGTTGRVQMHQHFSYRRRKASKMASLKVLALA